jgi:hypothetical protein
VVQPVAIRGLSESGCIWYVRLGREKSLRVKMYGLDSFRLETACCSTYWLRPLFRFQGSFRFRYIHHASILPPCHEYLCLILKVYLKSLLGKGSSRCLQSDSILW